MEHEVLVPLPPQTVRRSLRRPELLAFCLPGFTPEGQPDPEEQLARDPEQAVADQPALVGRLKLRIGGSSITYRGELRLLETRTDRGADGADGVDPTTFALAARQSVGSGEVSGTIRVAAVPAGEEGSRVVFHCDLTAGGRIAELDPQAVLIAARRLLDRFCAALAAAPGTAGTADDGDDGDDGDDAADGPELFADLVDLGELTDLSDLSGLTDFGGPSDFDAPGFDSADDLDAPGDSELFLIEESSSVSGSFDNSAFDNPAFDGAAALDEPWTDLPPNRRSIVGRSAEEVDHAPPSGRYGPALPPRSARSRAAARWGGTERRMGEPPIAEVDRNPVPWVVGSGFALLGGALILVRTLRRRR